MENVITGKCTAIVIRAAVLLFCFAAGAAATQVPTDHDQYLLELINRGRLAPAAEAARYGVDLNEGLDPDTISADPKQPLAFSPFLIDAAQNHSQWMLDQDVFSHTGAGGSSSAGRMAGAGYVFSAPSGSGENLGYRGSTGAIDPEATVSEIHRGLYRDEDVPGRGHRVNQLNPAFREIGVGVRFGVFTNQGLDYNTAMVTEDFAYSEGSHDGRSFITGVIWQDTAVIDQFYTPGGEGLGGVSIAATNRDTRVTYTTVTWASGATVWPCPTAPTMCWPTARASTARLPTTRWWWRPGTSSATSRRNRRWPARR